MVEFERLKYEKGVKKFTQQLESDLKYLSILANRDPIDKKRGPKDHGFFENSL
ncbi:MAG: hypothetical protein OEL52_04265 [Nitrosopumilus sp.]|nr:hypothetical protein [Nitrosopumilus sp.]